MIDDVLYERNKSSKASVLSLSPHRLLRITPTVQEQSEILQASRSLAQGPKKIQTVAKKNKKGLYNTIIYWNSTIRANKQPLTIQPSGRKKASNNALLQLVPSITPRPTPWSSRNECRMEIETIQHRAFPFSHKIKIIHLPKEKEFPSPHRTKENKHFPSTKRKQ